MNDNIAQNRFAPPRADVSDIAEEAVGDPVLASRWARLGAALIDILVGTVIYLGVVLPLYGLAAFRPGHASILPGLILYYVLNYAVDAWFLYRSSQTIGKIALNLRIVRPDGSRAGFARTFLLRGVVVGALGFIPRLGMWLIAGECLLIFGPARRCLHDYLADTIVVTATWPPAAVRAPLSTSAAR